jgi:threonyl-tRNA synthetase
MPLWLAPVQVVVLNISEGQSDYAARIAAALKEAGWRCEADLRNEKITYKIREHSLQKLPYQLIVGEKEKAAEKVAVRTRSGEDLGQMSLPDFVARLRSEAKAGSTA